jgi:Meiotically up-regulated gene 113
MAARNRSTKGSIYFILDWQSQMIKIGFSTNVSDRLSTLQTATANRLVLLGTRPGSMVEEARIHSMFRDVRKSGEWFEINQSLIEFIDAHTTVTEQRKAIKFGPADAPEVRVTQPVPVTKPVIRIPPRPQPPKMEPTPLAHLHFVALFLMFTVLTGLAFYSVGNIIVVWMPGDHMNIYRHGVLGLAIYAWLWAVTRRFRYDQRAVRPSATKTSDEVLADLVQ